MTFISYAQNFEDVMLARALNDIDRGFYVDVGAQDPEEYSVTKAFYDRGWRGINIEPARHWFDKLSSQRVHDTNLAVAVSDTPGKLHFFNIRDTGLSTTNAEFAGRHAQAGFQVDELDVPCTTLDNIFAEHDVETVHFLKIDCEGAEKAVLMGLSLGRVRPWVILVEATEPLSQKPTYSQWESLLTDRGYHFIYDDGLNRFYLADEHAELDAAFSHPANVFDDFLRVSELVARERLQSAQAELQALHDTHRIVRAEAESDQLRGTVTYLNAENERREAALVELRGLLAEAAEQEVRMHAENEEWRANAEHLREENTRMERTLVEQKKASVALEYLVESSRGASATVSEQAFSLEEGLATRERDLALLRIDFEGLTAGILDLKNEITRLHREVKFRDREVERLHGLIQVILRSFSWRVTLPLRFAKRGALAMMGTIRRIIYQLLRWPARAIRPLLRLMARWSWLRSLGTRIAGENSRLTLLTRAFLFGADVTAQTHGSPDAQRPGDPLTRKAECVFEELQDVRRKQLRSVGSSSRSK